MKILMHNLRNTQHDLFIIDNCESKRQIVFFHMNSVVLVVIRLDHWIHILHHPYLCCTDIIVIQSV